MSKEVKRVAWDQAEAILIDSIKGCDADTLASVFGDFFGYDVKSDNCEGFECTPNSLCGFVLDDPDIKKRFLNEGE